MNRPEQPLLVQLKVEHHARFLMVVSATSTLCAAAAFLTPSATWTSPSDWFVMCAAGVMFAVGLLTRAEQWSDQPLQVFAQGLQIGTLFRDLRAPELRECTIQGNVAQLTGRLRTLRLSAQAADIAALRERLDRLGLQPESDSTKRRQKRTLLLMPVGAIALISIQESLRSTDAASVMRESLPLVALLLGGGSLIAQSVDWLQARRAGYRV